MMTSYDFSTTRDGLIKGALRVLGIIKAGTNPPTSLVTDCAEALNMMIKMWQAEEIGLWLNKTIYVFLQYATASFRLGPSGDHATSSYVVTTLSADADTAATTITVTSTTGIATAYYIAVELDDETLQWSTVSGTPSGYVVTLATALTGDASSGNTVYCYQTKTQRPLQILEASILDSDDNEIPIPIVSDNEYWNMSDKTTTGNPNIIYYDPQTTNGVLYIWPTNDNVDNVLKLKIKYPLADLDSATDNPDFPIEWAEAIKFNLALRLAPELMDDIAEDRMKYILEMARKSKRNAQGFDAELNTSIYFQPDLDSY